MVLNKISEYQELLQTYERPDTKVFSKFNKKSLRNKPKTEIQEDKLESYCAHLTCQISAILKFGKTKEVSGIYSVISPESQSHIGNEIYDIFKANGITTNNSDGTKISIKL